jgi:hypothetical protein
MHGRSVPPASGQPSASKTLSRHLPHRPADHLTCGRRGREELAASLVNRPVHRVRQPGAGRPPVEKKKPLILSILEELVASETAGDPMTAQKWVRSSLRSLSLKLEAAGHAISPPTVGRLLRKARLFAARQRQED